MKPKTDFARSDGAVMVMATFAAIFLVGIVYHLAGIGGAALEQQIMQDAADSVAFSSATADARGMNLLALINLIMAAVLSVLVALRALQAVLAAAIGALTVACFVSGGAVCGAIAPLGVALEDVTEVADQIEPQVKNILRGLEKASDAVNRIVPVMAQAEAVYISRRPEHKPAEIGFAWPVTGELPTEKGSFEELCKKAGENVVVAATFFLPGGLPDFAKKTVGKFVGKVAGSFSSFFCGGKGGKRPQEKIKTEAAYPMKDHEECEPDSARPSQSSKRCETRQCDRCSQVGCSICKKAQSDDEYQRGLWTVSRDVWVEWENEKRYTIRRIEVSGELDLKWIDGDPCDGDGKCSDDPICAKETRKKADEASFPEGAERVTRLSYLSLHGCVIEESIKVKPQGEQLSSDEMSRPRVLKKDEFPEAGRVRSFVLGKSGAGKRLGMVAVGGSAARGGPPSGRLSFAAAEFLSNDNDLWHMTWRSRLIRFRTPSNAGSLGDSCSGDMANECKNVASMVDSKGGIDGLVPRQLGDFILH